MEEFQVYLELNRSCRHDFLYPLIFRDSLINRLISSTNDSNQNPVFGHNNNLYSQMIAAGFAVIVEIPFSLRLISYSQGAEAAKSHNLQSIHSIIPFLEDKFSHLNYVLEALIPHPIHLEILVQALRYWVKDASSLHLLRFSLYEYCNLKSFITPKKSISIFNPRLFLFLYNSHTFFLERIFFYGKIKYLGEVFYNDFQNNLWLFKDPFIHFFRYQGKSILASKDTSLLINKWKYYFVDLWQYYFYLWSQSGRVRINQLSKYSLDFLGYLSSVRLNPSVVRSQMLENSFLIDNAVKTLDTRIPIISLIGSLSKAKFCNTLGHPISSKFLEEFFTETEEEHFFSLIFPRGFFALRKFYRGRIWYLDIICINALVNHS
ncbi:hypothetical protein V6Z12_D03G090600 [Gossypium hirsutum]